MNPNKHLNNYLYSIGIQPNAKYTIPYSRIICRWWRLATAATAVQSENAVFTRSRI